MSSSSSRIYSPGRPDGIGIQGIDIATRRLNTELVKTFQSVSQIKSLNQPTNGKKYDTTKMLKDTSVECRSLLAKLNNIVTTEESMHQ